MIKVGSTRRAKHKNFTRIPTDSEVEALFCLKSLIYAVLQTLRGIEPSSATYVYPFSLWNWIENFKTSKTNFENRISSLEISDFAS